MDNTEHRELGTEQEKFLAAFRKAVKTRDPRLVAAYRANAAAERGYADAVAVQALAAAKSASAAEEFASMVEEMFASEPHMGARAALRSILPRGI